MSGGDREIGLDHFAGTYYLRMNCDDDLNPFMAQHWTAIDTTTAMAEGGAAEGGREEEEEEGRGRPGARRSRLDGFPGDT
jgi:hypothetical protein